MGCFCFSSSFLNFVFWKYPYVFVSDSFKSNLKINYGQKKHFPCQRNVIYRKSGAVSIKTIKLLPLSTKIEGQR